MFTILTTYLYQHKKLVLPGVGSFELIPESATTSFETVEAPGWTVGFKENKTATESSENFYDFLSLKTTLPKERAREQFEAFTAAIVDRLNKHEIIEWPGVGTLEKPDHRIAFTSKAAENTLFTGINAQKVTREHTDHAVLIGERTTSSQALRDELFADESKRRTRNKITWFVLAAVVVIAAAYFLKNGCGLQSAGNQQKVTVQKAGETYQLK